MLVNTESSIFFSQSIIWWTLDRETTEWDLIEMAPGCHGLIPCNSEPSQYNLRTPSGQPHEGLSEAFWYLIWSPLLKRHVMTIGLGDTYPIFATDDQVKFLAEQFEFDLVWIYLPSLASKKHNLYLPNQLKPWKKAKKRGKKSEGHLPFKLLKSGRNCHSLGNHGCWYSQNPFTA